MSKPVYKLEIYNPTGPALRHTIEKDALAVSITPRITSGVGTFNILLHRGSGIDWTLFNDVAHYDDIYIWLDFDSLSTNPRMRGKITNINDNLSDSALIQLLGKDYGEVLQRLLKTKYWESTRADTIVKEINDDAGLDGTYNHIVADATSLDYDAVDKPLIDILQDISEIRDKDWYVAYCYTHNAKELFWFARQTDTSTVTLEEGVNIKQYKLLKDLNPIRNDITVYGARLKTLPSDKDAWTDATTNWYSDGTITTNGDAIEGTFSVNFSRGGAAHATVYGYIDFYPAITYVGCKFPHDYRNLHFNFKVVQAGGNPGTLSLRLRKDASNYFRNIMYPEFHNLAIGGDWMGFVIPIGRATEGSGWNNEWKEIGTIDWDEIADFWFTFSSTAGNDPCEVRIDELYFGEARVVATQTDGGSQASYGVRDMVVIDDVLSASAVTDYATYLKGQLKDPIIQLDITSVAELDLQVGDQVPIEIPSKSISTNYDLLQVTHSLSIVGGQAGLTSRSLLSDRKQIRNPVSFRDLASYMATVTKRVDTSLRGKIMK